MFLENEAIFAGNFCPPREFTFPSMDRAEDYAASLREHKDGEIEAWLSETVASLERLGKKDGLTPAQEAHVALERVSLGILKAEMGRRGLTLPWWALGPEEKPKRRLP